MGAQEKAEWRKDVFGGGSTWVEASVKEPVQRKQEEMFHGGGCMSPRKRKVPLPQQPEEMNKGEGDNRYFEVWGSDLWSAPCKLSGTERGSGI